MATFLSTRYTRGFSLLNPLGLARNLWHSRDLIGQFTSREIEGRYRGSFLGLFWTLINPLALLGVYTFIFGVVFKSRWPQARTDSLADFALILFCGMATFTVFSECVSRAPVLIVNNPNYVKKVVFPLEILPISVLGAALFHGAISLSIVIVANLLLHGSLPWTVVLVPIVALPLVLLTLGVSWLLASLGVFIRDMSYVITLLVQILFFITPIFFAVDVLPKDFQPVLRMNPFTDIVDNMRRVVLWGQLPDWQGLAVVTAAGALVTLLGYAWFMRTKRAFADVL